MQFEAKFPGPADGPTVVLATKSHARGRMMVDAGVPCIQIDAGVDEDGFKESMDVENYDALDMAIALAEIKALRVAGRLSDDHVVIGADQILVCADRRFDKPDNRAEAREQLLRLAGKQHSLISAVVVFRSGGRIWHHAETVRLWMRPLTPAFVDAYLDAVGERALLCAGAYEIERLGAQLFSRIEGDHSAILGMPLLPLLECLRQQGVLYQ